MRRYPLVLVLAACGSAAPRPQPPGTRGPHASEELEEARRHDERAHEKTLYPDVRRTDSTGRTDQLLVGTPWHRTWDSPEDEERMAATHRGAAAQLYADYEKACGTRPQSEVSVSPLVRFGTGGSTVDNGVVIYLTPQAGGPDKLLSDIDCHRAWMMLAPGDMDDCPLDLAGISFDAVGAKEGITLTITSKNRAVIGELQRRAAHELEKASKLQSGATR